MTLHQKIINFLQLHPNQRFTAREIAEWIFITFPKDCKIKQENSKATKFPLNTDEKLISQLVAEVGSHKKHLINSGVTVIPANKETKQKQMYCFPEGGQEEIIQLNNSPQHHEKAVQEQITEQDNSFLENDLYPLLAAFLTTKNLYSKRIDEKRSVNNQGKNGNKWLFPDIVAAEDLSINWSSEVKRIAAYAKNNQTRLWSFEVKREITRSNIREVFFQTVSNSSWANFAYLVAVTIKDIGTMEELNLLSSLHGIGVIQLDPQDPLQSEILIPARERIEVDWNNASRLADQNKDFADYLTLIKEFYQIGRFKPHEWVFK